jgi:hypothetical protein
VPEIGGLSLSDRRLGLLVDARKQVSSGKEKGQ